MLVSQTGRDHQVELGCLLKMETWEFTRPLPPKW